MGQYKFKIIYTPEKDNGRADTFSRRKDLMDREPINGTLLKKGSDGALIPVWQANIIILTTIQNVTNGAWDTMFLEELIRHYHNMSRSDQMMFDGAAFVD